MNDTAGKAVKLDDVNFKLLRIAVGQAIEAARSVGEFVNKGETLSNPDFDLALKKRAQAARWFRECFHELVCLALLDALEPSLAALRKLAEWDCTNTMGPCRPGVICPTCYAREVLTGTMKKSSTTGQTPGDHEPARSLIDY